MPAVRDGRLETGSVFAGIAEEFFGPKTTQMPADRLLQ